MPANVSRRSLLKSATGAAALTLVVPLRTGAITGTAVVTTDVLRIRSGPGAGYEIIGRTYDGDTLTVLEGPTSGFYSVRLGTVQGWVSADYISVTPDAATRSGTGTTMTRLNLRSGASTSFGVL